MSTKAIAGVVVTLGLLIGLYFFVSQPWKPSDNPTPPPPPNIPISLTSEIVASHWKELLQNVESPPNGAPNAPYTIIEIGDFQCPQCGKVRPIIENLVSQSHGNLKMYFFNFPLPMHEHAMGAALAGLAAAHQGKFWPMYDFMYTHQDYLIPSEIEFYSSSIPGLDEKKLTSDLNSSNYADELQKQLAIVNSMGVQYTPTILLRKGNEPPTFYIGMTGEGKVPGVKTLAENPPWGR